MSDDIERSTAGSTDEEQAKADPVGDDEMLPASDQVFQCEPMNGLAMVEPTADEVLKGAVAGEGEGEGGGEGSRAGGPVDDTDSAAGNLLAKGALPVDFEEPEVVWVAEVGLAKKMGVSREVLRDYRMAHLVSGRDWMQRGKGLYLRQEAAQRAVVEIAKNGAGEELTRRRGDADGEKQEVETGMGHAVSDGESLDPHPGPLPGGEGMEAAPLLRDGGAEVLVVTRLCRNPHLVLARDGQGAECRVQVRSSVNLVAGMEMPCRHVAGDLWSLDRACPRFRGRW